MASIALFLARSLGPPMTGRKAVIRTAIAALAAEGHEVDLFVLGKGEPAPGHGARRTFYLGLPPTPRVLGSVALSLIGANGSLNEALFRSPRLIARVRELRQDYHFAVADTIRAAAYADALGRPWHLDLDDLFSARYEGYLEQLAQLSAGLVLGYHRDSAPRLASALPKVLLRQLLKREAAVLRRREVYWARKATTVSLVSPSEARSFAQAAGRAVHSLPMSVAVPTRCWEPGGPAGRGAVFLGGLDYKPNLDALLHYQEVIAPSVKDAPAPVLHHIGHAPPELRRKFSPAVVRFEGYVADLVSRLADAAFFIAPIVSGTGIKTKVLEAMAVGLPVLTTPQGIAGLQAEHRTHCYVFKRPGDFAEGVRHMAIPEAAREMGLAARRYVAAQFSLQVLRQRWAGVITELHAR